MLSHNQEDDARVDEADGNLDEDLEIEPIAGVAKPDAGIEPAVNVDATWQETYESEVRVDQRYSLKDAFLVMTVLAVGMSVARLLGPSLAATVLGIATLVGLFWVMREGLNDRVAYLGWWTLLALYLCVSLMAIISP